MKKIAAKVKNFFTVDILLFMPTFFVYAAQAFKYVHELPSQLDEGSFLIKGYYFVAGIYQPFQEYGPWTNNMPLAYYIPGVIQYLFGPGLRQGRYFMIFLALLMLLGCWLVMRRLCGKWWALLGAWLIALDPAIIMMYSKAVSEGIVACGLVWTLYFMSGKEADKKSVVLASLMSVVVVFIRQNMILLVPFLIGYYFLFHGKKNGITSIVVTVVLLVAGHLLFFPRILSLWYPWAPGFLKPLFSIGWLPISGTAAYSIVVDTAKQLASIENGVQNFFLLFMGLGVAMLAIASKPLKTQEKDFFQFLYLLLFFLVLFLMHAWASLGHSFCVGCFTTYVGFYYPVGILVAILAMRRIHRQPQQWVRLLTTIAILAMLFGLMWISYEPLQLVLQKVYVPRVKNLQLQGGFAPLWSMLVGKFKTEEGIVKWIAVMAGTVGVGAAAGLVSWLISILFLKQKGKGKKFEAGIAGPLPLVMFAFAALAASGLVVVEYSKPSACHSDVIRDYETVGAQLASQVQPGRLVYWAGQSVVTPLLYLPQAKLFPPQLNGIYNMRKGGESDALEKAGYYNVDSAMKWREEADYFLINNRFFITSGWEKEMDPDRFSLVVVTDPIDGCNPNSTFLLYKRIR